MNTSLYDEINEPDEELFSPETLRLFEQFESEIQSAIDAAPEHLLLNLMVLEEKANPDDDFGADSAAVESFMELAYAKLRQMVTTISQLYPLLGADFEKFYAKLKPTPDHLNMIYMKRVVPKLAMAPKDKLAKVKITACTASEYAVRIRAVEAAFELFSNPTLIAEVINSPIGPRDIRAIRGGRYKMVSDAINAVTGIRPNQLVFEKRKRGVKNLKRKMLVNWEFTPEYYTTKKNATLAELDLKSSAIEQLVKFTTTIGLKTQNMPKVGDPNVFVVTQLKRLEIVLKQIYADQPQDVMRYAHAIYNIRLYDICLAVQAAMGIARDIIRDTYRIVSRLDSFAKTVK